MTRNYAFYVFNQSSILIKVSMNKYNFRTFPKMAQLITLKFAAKRLGNDRKFNFVIKFLLTMSYDDFCSIN